MKNRLTISILTLIIGLLIITVPLFIFPVCAPHMNRAVDSGNVPSHHQMMSGEAMPHSSMQANHAMPTPPADSANASAMMSETGEASHGHPAATAPVTYMACHWTAQAEIGVGAVVILLGGLLLFASSAAVRIGLSLALACVALLVAAIPGFLIGVCQNPLMGCRMGTLPALLLLAGGLFVLAIINAFYLNKSVKTL